jgi:hypothetical protein
MEREQMLTIVIARCNNVLWISARDQKGGSNGDTEMKTDA